MEKLATTSRTRLRRQPERASFDRAALDQILDEGWIVSVAYVGEDEQPVVIPTTYVRLGRSLYVHGAVAILGAYDSDGDQVGYLRVVSDCTRFAYVMDVYVAGEHRRCGLGRAMVRFALSHPRHRTVARWLLGTRDAHGVYAHEGFTPLADPHRLMQRTGPGDWQEDGPPVNRWKHARVLPGPSPGRPVLGLMDRS